MERRPVSLRASLNVWLFLFGFLWTLAEVPLGLHAAAFGHWFELSTVARNLAASGQFRDPFGTPTGPTAHVAPVYAGILAAAIVIFKDPGRIVPAMIVLNAILIGISAALLPAISQRVYGAAAPGILGGVLLSLSNWLMPQWEVALSTMLLIGATFAILERGPGQAGLWCGASFLTNPTSLAALGLMALYRRARFAAGALALALLMCAPWMLRNQVELGSPYFIRDNLGLELWLSNSGRSSPETVTNWPLWNLHPNQNPEEAKVVAAMGEGRYNQMRMREARQWIGSHPKDFLRLTAGRAFYYWLPARREGWPAPLYWFLTAAGAWGLWLSRRNRLALLLALASVLYSGTFLLTATHLRHRYPSLWIWALLAGYAIVSHRAWRALGSRLKQGAAALMQVMMK